MDLNNDATLGLSKRKCKKNEWIGFKIVRDWNSIEGIKADLLFSASHDWMNGGSIHSTGNRSNSYFFGKKYEFFWGLIDSNMVFSHPKNNMKG